MGNSAQTDNAFASYRSAYRQKVSESGMSISPDLLDAEEEGTEKPLFPYVGLRHFNDKMARLLFGRREAISGIIERFDESQIVFVLGGSGSGKSSIVRGGVLSRLRYVTDPIGQREGGWSAIEFRPATRPVDELKKALRSQLISAQLQDGIDTARFIKTTGMEPDAVWPALEQEVDYPAVANLEGYKFPIHEGFASAQYWADLIDEALRPPPRLGSANLAILVDQFEEIFRSNVDHDQASKLLSMIRHIHEKKPEGVYLIITMRSEDLHRCSQEPGLAEIVNSSLYLVDWLDESSLKEAIYRPAQRILRRWKVPFDPAIPTAPFHPKVVDKILANVRYLQTHLDHKEDHLPLFQHALTWLWDWKLNNSAPAIDGRPFEITEEDFEKALSEMGGNHNWMIRALSKDVKSGLEAAIAVYAQELADTKPPSQNEILIAKAALRASLCAIASTDENGRFYREFILPEEIVDLRLKHQVFGKDKASVTKALGAALDELVKRGFLVCTTVGGRMQYDVTHEALIRNSKIRSWVDREADLFSAFLTTNKRNNKNNRTDNLPWDEDLPKLAVLFNSCDAKRIAKGTQNAYDCTFQREWVEKAVARRLAQDFADDAAGPAPVLDGTYENVKRLYRLGVEDKHNKEQTQLNEEVRRRTRKMAVGGGILVVLLTVFAFSLVFRNLHFRNSERNLLQSMALAASPGEASQYLAANIYEFKHGFEIFGANYKSETPWYAMGNVSFLSGAHSNDEVFMAHANLDARMRKTFGHNYQIVPFNGFNQHMASASEVAPSGDGINTVCIVISRVENDNQIYSTIVGKIEPDGARFWGLNLASNEKVSREQQFVRPKINSTKEGVEVGRLPREFYFAPGQGGQICTNDDGSILTISRDALPLTDDKDGSITGPPATPVPEVYSVHTDFVSGLHTSPVDFLQFSRILAGNRFHKDDPRFSGLQIDRGPRILKFSDPAAPNWVLSFEFEPAIAYDKDKAQTSDTSASPSTPVGNLVGFFSPELKVLQEFEDGGLTDMREVSLAKKTIELSLLQPEKSIPDMDGTSVSVLVTIANCSSSTLFYTLVVADGDLPSQVNTVNCDKNLKEATDGSFTNKLELQGDQDWLAVNPKSIGLATWTEQKPHLALVIETQDDRQLRVPIQLHPETIIKLLDNILKATLSEQHGNNANLTSVCYNMESCKNGNLKP